MKAIRFLVNGAPAEVEVPGMRRLLDVLREDLGLTGTKEGCGEGECGACSVLLDGQVVDSCLVPMSQVDGRIVRTVEGLSLAARERGDLDTLQEAFLEFGAAQCGICTPGMLMAADALLAEHPEADEQQIRDGIGGVLCRCTGYAKIVEAIAATRDARRAGGPVAAAPRPGAGTAVGSRIAKVDGAARVLGTARFGADERPPSWLTVRAIRSPHPRA
ncbi:MAG: (2Fe-2S)-binding protein, partial [Chloroflexota bacterium]